MSATETASRTRKTAVEQAQALGALASHTPVEIDTVAMELDREAYGHYGRLDTLIDYLRRLDGQKLDKDSGVWRTVGGQVADDATVVGWALLGRITGGDQTDILDIITKIVNLRGKLVAIGEQAARIDAEYNRRPWTRYVAVAGGHVHSGMWCVGGTIGPRTQRNWAPKLSGQTVEQAIAALQTTMCTLCFKNAPVLDKAALLAAAGLCAGSGQFYNTAKAHETRCNYKWGFCPSCDTKQTLTPLGYMRQHKVPTEPKAKPGQPANADGSPVYVATTKVGGGVRDEGNALKTMVAVNRAAMSAARDLNWYGQNHMEAPGWIETLNRMVPLLAADKGKTEQEVREELAAKAKKANR